MAGQQGREKLPTLVTTDATPGGAFEVLAKERGQEHNTQICLFITCSTAFLFTHQVFHFCL